MQAAHTSARDKKASAPEGARCCLVTGEDLAKSELIRFVVAPDGTLVPDLAHNLPGRGLWVKAERGVIQTAAKKNLFAKAAKISIKADRDLADQVVALMRKRCLAHLGLAKRSGLAVLGQSQVEAALKAEQLGLLLLASDASSDFSAFRAASKTPSFRGFSRDELGTALGQDQLVYVGLKPHALTAKLQGEIVKLEKLVETPHIVLEMDRNT